MPTLLRPFTTLLLGIALATGAIGTTGARDLSAQATSEPFTVEYYYKIKWGFAEEWMDLYQRNHYPILLQQQEMGRILRMSAATPVNHAGEASRWDLRFTIVWKDAATAHDRFDSVSIVRALYPDQDRFAREEQRRFELLLEHTDVPVWVDDLKEWKRD